MKRQRRLGGERRSPDREVLAGIHPVLEALRGEQPVEKIYLEEGHGRNPRLDGIFRLARDAGVPVLFAGRERLTHLAGRSDHQGVVALQGAGAYADPADILTAARRSKIPPILLLLDSVQDPQNLGSLLRSCDAVGVSGVFIPKRRSVGLSPGVARASAGAMAHVRVARVGSLVPLARALKEEGYWIVGGSPGGTTGLWEMDLSGPVALLLGGEAKGLSRPLLELCDVVVRIPMRGRVNSLNVGVAGALCLYELLRRRDLPGRDGQPAPQGEEEV